MPPFRAVAVVRPISIKSISGGVAADDELRQIVLARVGDHTLRDFRAGNDRCGCSQFLRQIQSRQNRLAARRGQPLQSRRLHVDRMPIGIQLSGQARSGAHDALRRDSGTHARQ